MSLTDITIWKNGNLVLEGAEGRYSNGRLQVAERPPAGLDDGDRVKIEASGGFSGLGTYMGEDPTGTLNFKID